jgi:hypothetical protein
MGASVRARLAGAACAVPVVAAPFHIPLIASTFSCVTAYYNPAQQHCARSNAFPRVGVWLFAGGGSCKQVCYVHGHLPNVPLCCDWSRALARHWATSAAASTAWLLKAELHAACRATASAAHLPWAPAVAIKAPSIVARAGSTAADAPAAAAGQQDAGASEDQTPTAAYVHLPFCKVGNVIEGHILLAK